MADLSVTVDPDGGGDYTSLSSAEATEQATYADLVADTNTMTFNCTSSSGTADTTKCYVDGWTTNASYYVTVESLDGHSGKRPTTEYRIDITDTFDSAFRAIDNYVVVKNLPMSNDGATSANGLRVSADNCSIINCLVYDSGGDSIGHGFYCPTGSDNNYFINCIAINSGANGFHSEGNSNYFYNCVSIANAGYGFYCGGFDDLYAKNCYSGGNTGADYFEDTNGDLQVTTCYSEDGTETTTTAAYSTSSGCYFANVTAGSEDVNLTSTSSSLYDTGTDLSADAVFPFDYDYENTTRTVWNVGAHEFTSAAGLDITIAMYHYNSMRKH